MSKKIKETDQDLSIEMNRVACRCSDYLESMGVYTSEATCSEIIDIMLAEITFLRKIKDNIYIKHND